VKLFMLDDEKWHYINECSWQNRFRIKYLNHLNSKNMIYIIGQKILRLTEYKRQ
jgi:hypothetical protein